MTIYCDYREVPSTVPKFISLTGIKVKFTALPVGDYLMQGIGGYVCIERKTVSDYSGSLKSDHLNNQLYEMSNHYKRSFLILEGNIDSLDNIGIAPLSFYSSIAGTVIKRAPDGEQGIISIIPSFAPYTTAMIIKFIHDKITTEDEAFRLPSIQKSHHPLMPLQVLISFKDVGPTTGKSILNTFKSLDKFFMEFEGDIETVKTNFKSKVKGFGPKLVESVYNTIHEEVKDEENNS